MILIYILYSIGVIIILAGFIDLAYFVYKKIVEKINQKSNRQREIQIPITYMIIFLAGALVRIIVMSKNVDFVVLLKESFLFGLLFLLVVFNIKVIKNKIKNVRKDINQFSNVEKEEGKKLFTKKNKEDKQ